jgi:hypothetical protein
MTYHNTLLAHSVYEVCTCAYNSQHFGIHRIVFYGQNKKSWLGRFSSSLWVLCNSIPLNLFMSRCRYCCNDHHVETLISAKYIYFINFSKCTSLSTTIVHKLVYGQLLQYRLFIRHASLPPNVPIYFDQNYSKLIFSAGFQIFRRLSFS